MHTEEYSESHERKNTVMHMSKERVWVPTGVSVIRGI